MLHLTCIRLWKCWGILRVTGDEGILVLFWPLLLRWRFVNSCFAYNFLGIFKHKIRKQENLVQCLSFTCSHTFKNLYSLQTLWVSFSLWISSTLAWHPSCMESFTFPYIYLYSYWTFPECDWFLFEMTSTPAGCAQKSLRVHCRFSRALMKPW